MPRLPEQKKEAVVPLEPAEFDALWEAMGGTKFRPDFRFDADFYAAAYPDISAASLDA